MIKFHDIRIIFDIIHCLDFFHFSCLSRIKIKLKMFVTFLILFLFEAHTVDDLHMVNGFSCLNVCNKTNQCISIKYVIFYVLYLCICDQPRGLVVRVSDY